MTVAYLLPSNRPEARKAQTIALQDNLMRRGDAICVSDAPGIGNAVRLAFANVKVEIVRAIADDDDYNLPGSIKAIEVMEATPWVDVMVTGGVKTNAGATCVPRGARYGESPSDVAHYGACGSGLFMRSEAVRKYGLLDHDGGLLDNFIVLKAIESGATVRFCRLDTYRPHMSLKDMPREDYAAFQVEKQTLRSRFGVWGLKPRAHESPPVWDGEFA